MGRGLIVLSGVVGFGVLSVLVSCSSGGGDGTAAAVTGIAVPTEVSAVAAKTADPEANPAARATTSPRRILSDLKRITEEAGSAGDLPSSSDYAQAVVKKFVEIESLDVFGIITTIFNAVQQTNYAEAGNVGSGPYKCLVAWTDEGDGGRTQTEIQTWTVESEMTGGANEVHAWIEETRDGQPSVISVVLSIEQAPSRNDDDTLADLGVWEIRAMFDGEGNYFHATATVLEDGTSRLTIHEISSETVGDTPLVYERKGIIYRNADLGYGKVTYPDTEACWNGGDCSEGFPEVDVTFSYNENYLTVQVGSEDPQSFDRNDEHEIVHRYGLYYAADGRDVLKDIEFGFPLVDAGGNWGWYGSWQDNHQVWVGGSTPDDGTAVTRGGVVEGTPPTYTTKTFPGALQKITLVDGSLDQLEGIPAEIWLSNNFMLRWNGTNWENCISNGMGGCSESSDFTDRLPSLASTGEGDQRWIWISGWNGSSSVNYVYQTSGTAGFYQAVQADGRWVSAGGSALVPEEGDTLWCSVSGKTYIMYTGDFDGPTTTTGWVEKTLESFDTQTWTPTFVADGDREFYFEVGREYFVNNRGGNLRVTRTASGGDADDYRVFMEVARVAKPGESLDAIYPDGTILVSPWDPDNQSTFVLEKDPEATGFLLLKYNTVSTNDENNGKEAGDIVTDDQWGLRAQEDAGSSLTAGSVVFNYQYQAEGEYYGSVTYLIADADGSYVLLHDPLRFDAIQLPRTRDLVPDPVPEEQWLSFAPTFDGTLQGLPDTWFELEKVNYAGDEIPDILGNNVVVPDGTVLVDAQDVEYYVKALDVGIFLGAVDAYPAGEEPDMDLTAGIDLDADLPTFVPHDLGQTPPDADLRYVEGIAVE